MPYKSEKIKIVGTKHDRRVKLDEKQKEEIRFLYKTGNYSWNSLARKFEVSKRLIGVIINPEMQKKIYQTRLERGGSKIYYDKNKHKKAIKNLRRYKQELFLKGEI